MNPVRILSVGAGGYAAVYLEALQKLRRDDVAVVGMVEPYPQFSPICLTLQKQGVPLYADMEDFFREHPGEADLAVITTPIHLHTRQTLCALAHGCHVMCEKPMSGQSSDEPILEEASRNSGKFVAIGYQWSYSPAILALKNDIRIGRYGAPLLLKTMVHWPRPRSYFTRGSGWGGRILAPDGTVINDSILNNAAAHYLHNILYVTGAMENESREAEEIRADLLRVHAIENFDTAALSFTISGGGRGLYLASHSTRVRREPMFEYRFTGGTVTYRERDHAIIGHLPNGEQKNYGDPFDNINKKIEDAIEAVRRGGHWDVPCGIRAAAPQVRCVEVVQRFPIRDALPKKIRQDSQNPDIIYLDGLDEILLECYEREILPSSLPEYGGLIRHDS